MAVTVGQVQRWLALLSSHPNEEATRERLREVFSAPLLTAVADVRSAVIATYAEWTAPDVIRWPHLGPRQRPSSGTAIQRRRPLVTARVP